MAEYIEREELLAEYDRLHTGEPGRARKLIAEAPTIDVVEVRHGRWLDCENHNDIEQCSVCGMIYHYPSLYKYNYCPNCGARMDGE